MTLKLWHGSEITLLFICLCWTGAVEAEKPRRGHPNHVCYHCLLGRHRIGVSLEENMIEGKNVSKLSEAAAYLLKKVRISRALLCIQISCLFDCRKHA